MRIERVDDSHTDYRLVVGDNSFEFSSFQDVFVWPPEKLLSLVLERLEKVKKDLAAHVLTIETLSTDHHHRGLKLQELSKKLIAIRQIVI